MGKPELNWNSEPGCLKAPQPAVRGIPMGCLNGLETSENSFSKGFIASWGKLQDLQRCRKRYRKNTGGEEVGRES